ncbi:MAG: hypothetical protein JWM44_4195 [Bacilli bacterium]|nr:hypothetical protein [Bacilli bacterium]
MISLRAEQTYFIGQQIKNPNITLDQIARKIGLSRDEVDMYLFHNYSKFEPYIKDRRRKGAK